MGGDDAGLVGVAGCQIPQDGALGGHIQCAGGLVQQQHRGVPQQGPGNGDALGLSLGQAVAVLPHGGVQPAVHGGDEVPGAGGLQRRPQLGVGGVGLHHPQIAGDGAGEEGVALGHIGEIAAESGVHLHLPPVGGLEVSAALRRADQAQQQADHGGLAAAGGAHQSHGLPGSGPEIGMGQHRLMGNIGVARVLHSHGEALGGQAVQSVVRQHRLRLQGVQVPDTAGGHRRAEERRYRPHQGVEGGAELGPLGQEQRHGAVENFAGPQQIQAVAEGRHLDGGAQKRQENFRADAEQIIIQAGPAELLLPAAEAPAIAAGDAEALDGVQIVQRLRLVGHQAAAHLADLLLVGAHAPDQAAGRQQQEGGAGQGQQGHDPVIVQDHRQGGGEGVRRDDQVRQPADGAGGHGAHVGGQAAEQVAAGKRVQGPPVGPQQAVEHLGLDIVVHPEGDFRGNAGGDAAQQQTHQGRGHHHGDDEPQVVAVVAGDDVDGVFAGHGRHQAQGGAGHAQDGIEPHRPPVALGIAPDPLPVGPDLGKRAVPPAADQGPQRLRAHGLPIVLLPHIPHLL